MSESQFATGAAAASDDMALARRIAGGDNAAFEQLMRRYNPRLYRVARAALRDEADAEDALQEAYIAAYRAMGRFRGDASLATWLSRLVLNECLGRLRREKRRDNILPMHGSDVLDAEEPHAMAMQKPSDSLDNTLIRAEMRALIERRLDELPEDFRLVFVLRSVEELSVEETALSLDIPEATVRTRHFRAKSLLRTALAQDIDVAERDVFSFGGARCDRIVSSVERKLREAAS